MADGDVFSQVSLSGESACEQWTPNKFKQEVCASCSHHFLDHGRGALTAASVQAYLDYVSAKYPCNEILAPEAGRGALYLGSVAAACLKEVQKRSIRAICQTAGGLEDFYPAWGKKLRELEEKHHVAVFRTGWVDSPDQDITAQLEPAVDFIHSYTSQGHNVLVHCAQGKSRSASLVVAYLLFRDRSLTLDAALKYVQAKRSIAEPNSGFMRQLKQYESKIRSTA